MILIENIVLQEVQDDAIKENYENCNVQWCIRNSSISNINTRTAKIYLNSTGHFMYKIIVKDVSHQELTKAYLFYKTSSYSNRFGIISTMNNYEELNTGKETYTYKECLSYMDYYLYNIGV